MYPDSGYKLAHAQSVCTRPFSPRWEGPGDEATRLLAFPGLLPFQVSRNYDGYCRFSGSLSNERHFDLGRMQQRERSCDR